MVGKPLGDACNGARSAVLLQLTFPGLSLLMFPIRSEAGECWTSLPMKKGEKSTWISRSLGKIIGFISNNLSGSLSVLD